MSCFFALLGADVVGVDTPGVSLDRARHEAERWGVQDWVRFLSYDGVPTSIPQDGFDFALTKSVPVVVPELEKFLRLLSQKMGAEGELLMAETVAGGPLLHLVRRLVIHWLTFDAKFSRVESCFLSRVFDIQAQRNFYWLVVALRAKLQEG
jgi:SAM-dependent methyltransferase